MTDRILVLLTLVSAGAPGDGGAESRVAFVPRDGTAIPVPAVKVLAENGGVKVTNGGFGSAMARDPKNGNVIYLLTDRGPNVDGAQSDVKVFAVPDFTPQIGKFEFVHGELKRLSILELRAADGSKLTGSPSRGGNRGSPVEAGLDLTGKSVGSTGNGMDSEGLVALADGTFWISEEYGPSLIHVNAEGKAIEWIGPGTGKRELPRVLSKRRVNNGFEGLTLLADGKRLAAIVQGPLENPGPEARGRSRVVRIVTFDLTSGATQQFLYVLETPLTVCSDIVNYGKDRVLVVERDNGVPGDPQLPSRVKKVFLVDLASATDVSDPNNGPRGLESKGKTIEQLTPEELTRAGIVVCAKREVLDLLKLGYPHEKPEGIAVFDNGIVAIVNDDDFGVAPDRKGGIVAKRMPAAGGAIDAGTIRFYRIL